MSDSHGMYDTEGNEHHIEILDNLFDYRHH